MLANILSIPTLDAVVFFNEEKKVPAAPEPDSLHKTLWTNTENINIHFWKTQEQDCDIYCWCHS